MILSYSVNLENPETHRIKILIKGQKKSERDGLVLISARSLLMRPRCLPVESSLLKFQATTYKGLQLNFKQKSIDSWLVEGPIEKSNDAKDYLTFVITYELYIPPSNDFSSSVGLDYATLIGGDIFLGVVGFLKNEVNVKFEFSGHWSRISTTLTDCSQKRDEFIYSANTTPLLWEHLSILGCHETDGFRQNNIDHEFSHLGRNLTSSQQKKEIQDLSRNVFKIMPQPSFQRFLFFMNCTTMPDQTLVSEGPWAYISCNPFQIEDDNKTVFRDLISNYISTWFNVDKMNFSGKHERSLDHSNLCYGIKTAFSLYLADVVLVKNQKYTVQDYTNLIQQILISYLSAWGRKYFTIENSSWLSLFEQEEEELFYPIWPIKIYLLFLKIHIESFKQNISFRKFITSLLDIISKTSMKNVDENLLLTLIKGNFKSSFFDQAEIFLKSTEEFDWEKMLSDIGISLAKSTLSINATGFDLETFNDNIYIKKLAWNGSGMKVGLQVGDEIVAIEGQRVQSGQLHSINAILSEEKIYKILINREGRIREVELLPQGHTKNDYQLKIKNESLLMKFINHL